MDKKLEKIIFAHLGILLTWGFLFKAGSMTREGPLLNAVSILLFFTLYGLIYTGLSNKKIPRMASNLVLVTSLVPLALMMVNSFNFKILLGLVSFLSTTIYLKKFLVQKSAKYVNILPISRGAVQGFTLGFLAFLFAFIYLFDMDPVMIHVFIQLVFLIMEFFFLLFVKERESSYEQTYRSYYLFDYMARERDEFARIIHDEMIQDIFATRNYLSLKNPDIAGAKSILSKLENKLRQLMKFYQSNLFEPVNIETSIDHIIQNLSSLYENKEIEIYKEIALDQETQENDQVMRLLAIISKELINNVYKHSEALYLTYKLYQDGDFIILDMESNGTSPGDYEKIKESKRGVLLLELLIDAKAGRIAYDLNQDVLTTKVLLGVENETAFIR